MDKMKSSLLAKMMKKMMTEEVEMRILGLIPYLKTPNSLEGDWKMTRPERRLGRYHWRKRVNQLRYRVFLLRL
ncbi:hypothetical protein 2 [Kumasi rhabdovirus]|uniref:Uncharacterized protein n=1 Tax=Kumasi rhabdovirus TaxID=1537975 RepID=A0A0C4ME12_9RHAB|nr:hypothetical protein 2 [Kumasi rhabdovirus]AIL31433.1 hypothetical protein 2 [Kumasi rhabdovirus]